MTEEKTNIEVVEVTEITIRVKGRKLKLTMDEAKSLLRELGKHISGWADQPNNNTAQ